MRYWGGEGSAPGKFNEPRGLAVDEERNVYVGDVENHRIQKFDQEGNYLTHWGEEGNRDGEFSYPRGLAVDGQGDLHVVDFDNHTIQKFDSDGNFKLRWGTRGNEDGEFENPWGLVFDSTGSLYVVENGNNRVQKFVPANLSKQEPTGVTIVGPDEVVIGSHHTYTATVAPANVQTPLTYEWAPDPWRGQGRANATCTWEQTGTQTLVLTATNAIGSVQGSKTVQVVPPTMTLTSTDEITPGVTALFTATIEPMIAYNYVEFTFGDGSQPVRTSTLIGNNQFAGAHIYATTGTYAVEATLFSSRHGGEVVSARLPIRVGAEEVVDDNDDEEPDCGNGPGCDGRGRIYLPLILQ
jgi:DNA-binding beta-propeller fold protein YncE